MDEKLNQAGPQDTGTQKPERKKTKTKLVLEMDNRRAIIFTVAGVYLLYLAFKILTGIGSAEGSRMVTHVIPIVAAVLFIAAGAWLLYTCVRAFLAQTKEQKDEETTEEE